MLIKEFLSFIFSFGGINKNKKPNLQQFLLLLPAQSNLKVFLPHDHFQKNKKLNKNPDHGSLLSRDISPNLVFSHLATYI